MIRPAPGPHASWLAASLFALALGSMAAAQTTEAAGDGTAETEADAPKTEEAPPEPELTGNASGAADGIPFSAKVDCTGFTEADLVRVQSDPTSTDGKDQNGDGVFLDASASRNRGTIDLSLSVNNTSYNFSGRLAQVKNQVLSYAVTLKSSSGPDISIQLKVDCGA